MQKMSWWMRLLYKWQKRKMCNCTSPGFEVIGKKLMCYSCRKPLHRLDVELN